MRTIHLGSMLPRTLLWLAARVNHLQVECPDYWSVDEPHVVILASSREALRLFVASLREQDQALTAHEPAALAADEPYVIPEASLHPDAVHALSLRTTSLRPFDRE